MRICCINSNTSLDSSSYAAHLSLISSLRSSPPLSGDTWQGHPFTFSRLIPIQRKVQQATSHWVYRKLERGDYLNNKASYFQVVAYQKCIYHGRNHPTWSSDPKVKLNLTDCKVGNELKIAGIQTSHQVTAKCLPIDQNSSIIRGTLLWKAPLFLVCAAMR